MTWPVYGDNPPIASGLGIEKGATLRVYQWREYLYEDVLEEFAKKFDVSYEVKNYETIQEGVAGIRGAQRDFDVFFPTVEVLGELVQSKELRPLNHAYLPNIDNLWQNFTGQGAPFYDVGQQYTVPYTVYSTGILTKQQIAERPIPRPFGIRNPYNMFWYYADRGTAVLDDYREAIAMALLRNDDGDVNTRDPKAIRRATDDLIHLGPRLVTPEAAYEGLPESIDVAQAWSGDVFSAPRVGTGDDSNSFFFWPPDGNGIVGTDLTAILARGSNPTLAHAFVNFLLDTRIALENFSWNGYQPPINGLILSTLDCDKPWVSCVDWLVGNPGEMKVAHSETRSLLLTPTQFERSPMLLPLDPETDALWQSEWQRFLQHAEKA